MNGLLAFDWLGDSHRRAETLAMTRQSDPVDESADHEHRWYVGEWECVVRSDCHYRYDGRFDDLFDRLVDGDHDEET